MSRTYLHSDKDLTPYRSSLRIALVYLLFSVSWIAFGDSLLLLFFQTPDSLTRYQTYKEFLFVGASVTVIFFLVKNALKHAADLQQVLREKEEKYRLLIENQNDLVVKVDPQGRFLYVSPNYCTTFGKTEAEILGQEFIPLVREAERKATTETEEFLWNQPPSVYLEQRVLTVQGWRWFGWSDHSVLDKDNNLVAVIGIGRDITASKAQEKELAREKLLLKSIIDNIPVMVTRYDPAVKILYLNKEFERCIGWSTESASTVDLMAEIYPDPEYRRYAKNYMDKRVSDWLELNLRTKDGAECPSAWSNIRLDDGTQIGIGLDLTQQKKAEQTLIRKTEEMEQLVYAVSHDLKSPLITIQTFLQLLKQDIESNDRELIAGNIDQIGAAADKIDTLLEALEQLSRIGKRGGRLTSICPNEVIDNTLAILSGPLLQKNISVLLQEIPFQLTADLFHLEQLWQNLIENAIKYMGDQPDPQINLGVDLNGGEPVFYVRDNGIGIAPEDAERVFWLFTQLDNNSGSGSGLGLGLALVKKIIDTYQGKIWVESEEKGQGSCFKFTLPAACNPLPSVMDK